MLGLALILIELTSQKPTTELGSLPVVNCSWYGRDFHGRPMANGERFDMNDPYTAAHKSLPFGTKVTLRNPANGRKIEVTVTDRGPYIHGREFDLSAAGAENLGFAKQGVAKLEIISTTKP